MTWQPASVKRMPGHVLVSPLYDMYAEGPRNCYKISPVSLLGLLGYQEEPTPYRFHTTNGSIYYVNGRKEVYETSIINPLQVVFYPVGREWDPVDQKWVTVMFRKLHKLEWLFA